MDVFTDQCGNRIPLSKPPQRIVSLVPSQSELLYDLGLEDRVSGITRYCIHPAHWQKTKVIIGGTKNFDPGAVSALKPDLIIGNKEENYREGILELQKSFPVWMSDIYDLNDALHMIRSIGAITHTTAIAEAIVGNIRTKFDRITKVKTKRTLYLVWRKPWMAAGRNTFIGSMLEAIGLENCLPEGTRYPELTNQQIRDLGPDLILLSSEPYPFKTRHLDEIKTISPDSKPVFVDGEMFSWYGSRLLKFPEYFNSLFPGLS